MCKLRNCQAEYGRVHDYTIFNSRGIPRNGGFIALKSYNSVVAFIDDRNDDDFNIIYLMPRYDYSKTTMSHVRKFIEDVAGEYLTIREMREYAKNGDMTPGGNFIRFARCFLDSPNAVFTREF